MSRNIRRRIVMMEKHDFKNKNTPGGGLDEEKHRKCFVFLLHFITHIDVETCMVGENCLISKCSFEAFT